MKNRIENIVNKVKKKENSTSFLIVHPQLDRQLYFAQLIANEILSPPKGTNLKMLPDSYGIWPENIEKNKIKIEQIQEFIRKTQLKPFNSKFKVGVLISAEKMTNQAQNALLKTLEEPPKNTFLVLTASNRSDLLKTVLSRCHIIDPKEKKDKKHNFKNIKKLLKSDIVYRFKYVEELTGKSTTNDINAFLENLLNYIRKSLMKKYDTEVIELIKLIESTQRAIEKNVNKKLALENLMINLPLKELDY